MNTIQPGAKNFLNLSIDALVQYALAQQEGVLAANGAFLALTGKRTGRSPKDRFIVKDAITEKTVDWNERNQAIDNDVFHRLWNKAQQHLVKKNLFVSHLAVGADARYQLPVTVITEKAWHMLFARHLFIRTFTEESAPGSWTLLNASSLKLDASADGVHSDAALILNFTEKKILLCGLDYAGEMKKALFSVLNFLLPEKDVLPMHCAANEGKEGEVALFFGLSGTGKTTLSADPERYLIGDDEHGWGKEGVFNFEGGCYAKCIDLQKDKEPVIWAAIRDGAIMENVVLKSNNEPDYHDATLTQNTRAAYPRDYIPLCVESNQAGSPSAVVFLTCDLYGVLPPLAKLSQEQAAYYFLSGYTALVGSTEVGEGSGIKQTFSTCFGAPFFPRPPQIYADLLIKRLQETRANVYLVNTGWAKGPYGQGGERFSIPTTRAIIRSVVSGEAASTEYDLLPGFQLAIPKQLSGVDSYLLDPRKNWVDKEQYPLFQKRLIDSFKENFKRFQVSSEILNAGPI
ncbi:MAG: phosphoenolpyruvate carboxykinase (ATP) [Gammaproteobacteria bacterium]|nr:phosphoenolpyruvate carboxykinase (ATP) [Gammaproteobacteria bacterium]